MALLTDGMISGLEDLQALDSDLLETSRNEGIDLAAKLVVSEEAVQLETGAFLLRTKPDSISSSASGAYDLNRVAVTPGLRRWHSLLTLAEVYGDAYGSQLNERYLGRWQKFVKLAKDTSDLVYELGIGIVMNPIPRAEKPVVTVAGNGGLNTVYTIRTAWRSGTGESGAPSAPATLNASNGELFTVDAGTAPTVAIGFDVYVGTDGVAPMKQNAEPMAPGTIWALPSSGIVTGLPAGDGQIPDYFVRRSRTR